MKTTFPIIIALMLASCSPCRFVANHSECFPADTIRETTTQTIRDTVTWIQADTFSITALFYCDSAKRVLMRDLEEYKTKGIITRIVYRDNRLLINAATDSIGVLNRIISNLKSTSVSIMNPVNEQLKKDNAKLQDDLAKVKHRMKNRSWLWYYFLGSLVFFALFAYWRFS